MLVILSAPEEDARRISPDMKSQTGFVRKKGGPQDGRLMASVSPHRFMRNSG